MTGDWRTSLVAVCIFIGLVCKTVVDWVNGVPVDFNVIIAAIITLLTALGLWKAADKANVKK